MEPELSAADDSFPFSHHRIRMKGGGDNYSRARPQHQTYSSSSISNSKENMLHHPTKTLQEVVEKSEGVKHVYGKAGNGLAGRANQSKEFSHLTGRLEMKDQADASYNLRKVICSTICTRGCRNSSYDGSSIKENAKLVYDSRIDMTGCTKSQTDSFARSLTALRDNNVKVHAVQHHFPSILSFVESLPLVGNVSHITTPESTNGHSESSCEGSSTSKAFQDVHIPARLMEEFMELASTNTIKNLETCGILGAFLKNRTFYVTTLIIPKQESTANSCQALNEEEIHAIQDGQSLFPVGWIHTHPSQTCFLSSIDLHTQYSYQVMLPEAIAIVMAPTDPTRSYGIFRLTDPGGTMVLKECRESGGFHLHPETCSDGSPIYESCSNVYINPNLRFEIIDLRSVLSP